MTAPQKVITASEPWAEYQLEDGTLLRFRLTACNFRKTGKTTDQGDPEYSFSHQMQCETIPAIRDVPRLHSIDGKAAFTHKGQTYVLPDYDGPDEEYSDHRNPHFGGKAPIG